VGLVQPALSNLALPVQRIGVEAGVAAAAVVIADVDVAVLDERPRRQQVVRLIARVVGAAERVQAERGGVGAEQDQEEGYGQPHRAQGTLGT
jgi:hypothetical protein